MDIVLRWPSAARRAIAVVFLLLGCRCEPNAKDLTQLLEPVSFDRALLLDLEKVGALVLRNHEVLMEAARDHYKYYPARDAPNRYETSYFIPAFRLHKVLPANDQAALRHLTRPEKYFRSLRIDFTPAESVVTFTIELRTAGDAVAEHKLRYGQAPPESSDCYGNEFVDYAAQKGLPKSKLPPCSRRLNDRWSYELSAWIDSGPL